MFPMGRSRRKKAGPIQSFIGGLLFTAVGGGLTFFKAYPDYNAAKESVNWPQTTGKITRSQVHESRDKDNKRMYKPDIEFTFNLFGQKIKSRNVYIGSSNISSSSSSDAREYTSKYPVGKEVTVYYKRDNPDRAILEPGVHTSHYVFLGGGILFAVIGLMITFSSALKLAVLAAAVTAIIGSLFGRNKTKGSKGNESRERNSRKQLSRSRNSREQRDEYDDDDIDLDDEMLHFNQVSSTSFSPEENPWDHKWYIKGKNKNYGPYSFQKVIQYYEQGKIKASHRCYPSSGGETIRLSEILNRKKAS